MRMAYGGPNPMNMPGFCAAGDSFNETRMNVRDGIFSISMMEGLVYAHVSVNTSVIREHTGRYYQLLLMIV